MMPAAQMRSLPDPIVAPAAANAPTVLALATAGMPQHQRMGRRPQQVLERGDGATASTERRPLGDATCSNPRRPGPAHALRAWHQAHGSGDTALAIDGKALRLEGRQAHAASSATTPRRPWSKKNRHEATPETEKRTNEIGTILPLLETVPDIAGTPSPPMRAHPAPHLSPRARRRLPAPSRRTEKCGLPYRGVEHACTGLAGGERHRVTAVEAGSSSRHGRSSATPRRRA